MAWFDRDLSDDDLDDVHDPAPLQGERTPRRGEPLDELARTHATQGIVCCDMDTALREHEQLVKAYFGTVIPPGDGDVAAFDTSVWSGGSFVYVPPGVEVELPLQSAVRTGSEPVGQFERTLIIADEGSSVHFIDGCSAPIYTRNTLHAAVVEIVVEDNANVTYTSIQNWSRNVSHLATKRARVEAGGHMQWIEGNIGSKLTVAHPAVHLVGDGATGEVLSVAYAAPGQHHDVGAQMVHSASNTTSRIVSKSISSDGGITTFGDRVLVDDGIVGTRSHVECDVLVLGADSASTMVPSTGIGGRDTDGSTEATVSRVAAEQLFYLMSRGLSEAQSMGVIVNGFIEPVIEMLPIEYAVEWTRLIELQMEGTVG